MPEVGSELTGELVTMSPAEAESYLRELSNVRPDLAARVGLRLGQLLTRQSPSDIGAARGTADWSNVSSTGDLAAASTESTAIDDMPARLGDGRYEVLEELGRGGFGNVYRGRDLRTGQTVALKTMRHFNARALESFKGEFRYLQGIAHRSLVQLLELSSSGNDWLIAMEYVDGIDFLSHVRPPGAIDADYAKLREAMGQLAEGVSALHRHRRLHRDLKPRNVRVAPDGRVVVLDFGLAAESSDIGELRYTDANTPGTVPYMAPEQFDSPPVSSTASDFYSLGVMLYVALTGETPFFGNLLRIVQAKRTESPLPPRELSPDVPDDLQDLCLALLARDPSDRPTANEILRRLGRTVVPEATQPAEDAELLGRDRHREQLEAAYEASRNGRAVVTVVQGPSGIGKSALIGRFVDDLRNRGARVFSGRCYEHESVPYKAFDPIVDELARHLMRLPESEVPELRPEVAGPLVKVFPILGRAEPIGQAAAEGQLSPDVHEVRRQAFAGLRELLTWLARFTPLAIYIDDLQWGDIDSTYLLTDFLLPPNPPNILWLLSHRSEDATAPCLIHLRSALTRIGVAVQDIRVDPLNEAETRALVVRHLGNVFEGHAGRIARESGGNPYFALELIQALRCGAESRTERELTLDGLIRSRVARLPEAARQLLEIVSVSGRPLGDADAFRALDNAEGARTLAAQLESARLMRGIGSAGDLRLETYHDRVREAILEVLPGDRRRRHHGRLATALELSGRGHPEELAQHFEGAGEGGKAGRYYSVAADRAKATLAFDQASDFYGKALSLGRFDPQDADALRRKMADALADAGRGAEAGPIYRSLADTRTGREEIELRRNAMQQYLSSGRTDEGLGELAQLFKRFGLSLPGGRRRALLRLILASVRLKLRGTKFRERSAESIPEELLQKIDVAYASVYSIVYLNAIWGLWIKAMADRWALDAGEPRRVTEALANIALLWASEGAAGYPRAATRIRLAKDLAIRIDNPFLTAKTLLYSGSVSWIVGRWVEMLGALDECERIVGDGRIGFEEYKVTLRHFRLDALMMTGRWREYSELVGAYLEDAQRKRNLFAQSAMHVHSYLPAIATGRLDHVEECVQSCWKAWPQKGNVLGAFWGLYGRVESALYRGDGLAATNLLDTEEREMGSHTLYKLYSVLHLVMLHLHGRATLAAAAQALPGGYFSRRARLLRSTARYARRIEKATLPWSDPLAALLRAGHASLRGDRDNSLRLLSDAERGFEAAGMRMYAAASCRQRGRLLGGQVGAELVRTADAFMASEGVREPDRIAAMLAPGFHS